eukprot:gnl/TRDRNA2_/TRDRNA2_45299_c0_seq1.p1 gnl/TRDRNA2_/TRDRNA2_45299_c0~~gnl/TRDRNA2_/TRDRNA2_45299_c0_seq1.p1  ORF type:complete len:976 (-),score=188.72 gnl/TRDRNA2_/TRDRNA2_45299_c0_seq1:296-3223(-)
MDGSVPIASATEIRKLEASFEDRLQQAAAANSRLNGSLAKSLQRQLDNETRRLDEKLDLERNQLQAAVREIKTGLGMRSEQEAQIANLQQQLTATQAEVGEVLLNQRHEQEAAISVRGLLEELGTERTHQLKGFLGQLEQSSSRVTVMESSVMELRREFDGYREQLRCLRSSVTELKGDMNLMQQEHVRMLHEHGLHVSSTFSESVAKVAGLVETTRESLMSEVKREVERTCCDQRNGDRREDLGTSAASSTDLRSRLEVLASEWNESLSKICSAQVELRGRLDSLEVLAFKCEQRLSTQSELDKKYAGQADFASLAARLEAMEVYRLAFPGSEHKAGPTVADVADGAMQSEDGARSAAQEVTRIGLRVDQLESTVKNVARTKDELTSAVNTIVKIKEAMDTDMKVFAARLSAAEQELSRCWRLEGARAAIGDLKLPAEDSSGDSYLIGAVTAGLHTRVEALEANATSAAIEEIRDELAKVTKRLNEEYSQRSMVLKEHSELLEGIAQRAVDSVQKAERRISGEAAVEFRDHFQRCMKHSVAADVSQSLSISSADGIGLDISDVDTLISEDNLSLGASLARCMVELHEDLRTELQAGGCGSGAGEKDTAGLAAIQKDIVQRLKKVDERLSGKIQKLETLSLKTSQAVTRMLEACESTAIKSMTDDIVCFLSDDDSDPKRVVPETVSLMASLAEKSKEGRRTSPLRTLAPQTLKAVGSVSSTGTHSPEKSVVAPSLVTGSASSSRNSSMAPLATQPQQQFEAADQKTSAEQKPSLYAGYARMRSPTERRAVSAPMANHLSNASSHSATNLSVPIRVVPPLDIPCIDKDKNLARNLSPTRSSPSRPHSAHTTSDWKQQPSASPPESGVQSPERSASPGVRKFSAAAGSSTAPRAVSMSFDRGAAPPRISHPWPVGRASTPSPLFRQQSASVVRLTTPRKSSSSVVGGVPIYKAFTPFVPMKEANSRSSSAAPSRAQP